MSKLKRIYKNEEQQHNSFLYNGPALTDLVGDEEQRDATVDPRDVSPVGQQVQNVGHRGRCPASPLLVELAKVVRTEGQGVRCSGVLHALALLQHQGAQPAVLPCTEATAKHVLRCLETAKFSGFPVCCGVRVSVVVFLLLLFFVCCGVLVSAFDFHVLWCSGVCF